MGEEWGADESECTRAPCGSGRLREMDRASDLNLMRCVWGVQCYQSKPLCNLENSSQDEAIIDLGEIKYEPGHRFVCLASVNSLGVVG